jgi:hypothetical protein
MRRRADQYDRDCKYVLTTCRCKYSEQPGHGRLLGLADPSLQKGSRLVRTRPQSLPFMADSWHFGGIEVE